LQEKNTSLATEKFRRQKAKRKGLQGGKTSWIKLSTKNGKDRDRTKMLRGGGTLCPEIKSSSEKIERSGHAGTVFSERNV